MRLALSYSVFTSWAKPQLLGCKWDTKALSMPPLQTLCANSVTNIKRRCRSDDEEKARITIQNGNERNDLKDIAVMQRIHAYFDALHQYAAMQVHCSVLSKQQVGHHRLVRYVNLGLPLTKSRYAKWSNECTEKNLFFRRDA